MNGTSGIELGRLEVRDLPGVFAARQAGRELADGLGLERQDQVRVATGLSEVSRSAVTAGLAAVVVFGADQRDLVLTVTVSGAPPDAGTDAAARLMDAVEVSGSVIRMSKRLPSPRPGQGPADTEALRQRLASLLPQTTMEELRRDNEDLIAALEDLRRQKEQLLLLNAELQETNRGVMALYNELSAELEQTNRGVVALYAELEEKSERLRAASESKDRFWTNVSHELRTPLNSILGLTRILADPVYGSLDDEQAHQVGLIRDSTSTMLALVNDLLDVAKAESGSFSLEPAHVRLPALLASLRGLTRPMAAGKPVDVVLSGDGVPATVLTDELALTAILRNLLSNAIRYTDSGEVRLTVAGARTGAAATTGTAGLLEISVSDTGPGIPPGQQERVFEEFYRVPGTRQRGTGLGLPYARRLAELLGGNLTLTSTLGEGTTVTLRLPGGMPSVGSVVVADDDPAFRQVLRAMLGGIAGRVTEAEDGAQALAAVRDSAADLLLTDVRMPGTDGISLLAELAGSVPAIVVTGTDAPRPAGAAALLHKENLTAERLAFAIRAIMEEST